MTTQDQQSNTGTGSTDTVGDRVSAAYASAKDRAGETVSGAASRLEANPFAALLGGIAVGAAIGALLPRSERERALLNPLGSRLGDAARAAIDAARDSGKQSFADSGFTGDQLRQQVSKLVEQALAAAGQAGTAAVSAARDTGTQDTGTQ
ncbi:hypothetical protein [uncultured Sphingomonas sp.]|uniref:hypothetical protein n=1 Tax=uncultured Sphingomonas sp. TaxID=158754 RepID=UPI0025F0231A|nr:hypothetical protein [uncultured Sphingomonas sp.]